MRTGTLPTTAILAAGMGMGTAGDFLLRGPGEPGLNFALLFAGLAASVGSVALRERPRLSREAVVWMATGVLLGTGLMWRGSELLRFLAFVSAAAAFSLPALHGGAAWVRQAGVADVLEAVAASGLHAALGGARLLQGSQWAVEREEESHRTARSAARSGVVGVLTAALPLSVFGGLFLSADPVFAGILGDFVRIDLASFASHLVAIAILSWLTCGYLAGFTSGTRLDGLRTLGWELPTLRRGEVAVALGLVDLLFLCFVVVQFRYLFGGAEIVEVTPGMTYAAYAREGFFQLLAATALGLPWLLVADRLLGELEESARWTYRALAGAQLLLLLAIVASALQRMRAYVDAYGLTEDRFVATAVLLWLTLLVLWFGATVLRGRRGPFAFGVLVSGFGLILLLQVSNPTAYAARSHLNRAEAALHLGSESGAPLDVAYLAGLGSDAVPVLVGRMGALTEAARCEVATALLSRWGPDPESDWRNWNLADWRARRLARTEGARLRAMAEGGGGCG
jgi:hypothetical protein